MRAFVISIVLAPAVAIAGGGNEVTVGSAARTLTSSSGVAVATDSLGGGTIAYAHELGALWPRFALWVEGEFAGASTTGVLFHTMTTAVNDYALSAGARLRYTPLHHLAIAARIDFGAARTSLDLTDSSGHTASDAGWSPIVRAATAVDLLAVDRKRFSFGVRLEAGYVATHGVTLSPTPQHSGDTLTLPMMATSIGRLDLSGPYVGVALTSRF
jgi:hypothetical protein